MTATQQLIADILADFPEVKLTPGELMEIQEDEGWEAKDNDREPVEPNTEQDF